MIIIINLFNIRKKKFSLKKLIITTLTNMLFKITNYNQKLIKNIIKNIVNK